MSLSNFANNVASSSRSHERDTDYASLGGGGTTVFGDGVANGATSEYAKVPGKAHIAHNIPMELAPIKFGQSPVDYDAKNKSLFIRIEDDGVLPALHKLNRQLKNVSSLSHHSQCRHSAILMFSSFSRSIKRTSYQQGSPSLGLAMRSSQERLVSSIMVVSQKSSRKQGDILAFLFGKFCPPLWQISSRDLTLWSVDCGGHVALRERRVFPTR